MVAGQSCEIVLTVLVEGGAGGAADQLSLPSTSPSSGSLDSILILRIEDSGDKFISIAGEGGGVIPKSPLLRYHGVFPRTSFARPPARP